LTLIVGLLGGSLVAQSSPPSAPAPNRQWLAGTWKLDKSGPPEDRKNWDRQVPPIRPPKDGDDGIRGVNEVGPRDYEASHVGSLRCFGHKLMIESEALVISVGPDAITIDDDLREPTRYAISQATTIRVVTGQIGQRTLPGCPVWSMNVRVKTSWNGNALVQELRTRDLAEIVRITRTFIPVPDGRRMLFIIKVFEPKLKEPVKDIERLYVRQPA
jgi:hypothetical protein